MKTTREWFNELPEPYKTEAINNTEVDLLDDNVNLDKSMCVALKVGFIWASTPQGLKYWDDLYRQYL